MKIGKPHGTQPSDQMLRPALLRDESGSQMVELGLVMLPLMAVVFLFVDAAWIFFAQQSLQNAVQTGVRAAITSYVPAEANGTIPGQDSYLKSVVQSNAMGFLSGQAGLNEITIAYYSPSNLSQVLTGSGSNAGGNVIEISVNAVPVSILGPIFGNASPTLSLSANSSDVMESSPAGGPPPR